MSEEIMQANLKRVGLCAGCRHSRILRSAKGHDFYRCEKSKDDPQFAPYPPLPVRFCPGHQAEDKLTEPKPSES